MKRLREIRLDFLVAGNAEQRILLYQQELFLPGVVRRVTIDTAHVVDIVRLARKVAVLLAVFMAGQATLADFRGRHALEVEDLGLVPTGINMGFARPVTCFASVPSGPAPCVQSSLPVRRRFEILEDVFVASLAGFRADIAGEILWLVHSRLWNLLGWIGEQGTASEMQDERKPQRWRS